MRRSDYWYFNNIFTPDRCQYIIDLGLKKGFHKGTVARKKRLNTKVRKSQVCFLHNQYLFDVINTYLPTANKSALWNYRYERIEDVQLTRYEKGDHYKPHTDISKGYDNIALHYTNILFLNDPKEYGGGELMVDIYGSSLPFKLEKNSILTYPTGLKHSVNPITRGKRYSLIWWSDSFISNEEDRVTLRTLEKLLMGVHEYMRDELSLEGNSTASHPLGEIGVHCNTIAERIHSKYPRSRDPQCYLITE